LLLLRFQVLTSPPGHSERGLALEPVQVCGLGHLEVVVDEDDETDANQDNQFLTHYVARTVDNVTKFFLLENK